MSKKFGVRVMHRCALSTGKYGNSLLATLPAEIFFMGISIFKGFNARRLHKSFGVTRLNSHGRITTFRLTTDRVTTAYSIQYSNMLYRFVA
jgi:hypothetical protein